MIVQHVLKVVCDHRLDSRCQLDSHLIRGKPSRPIVQQFNTGGGFDQCTHQIAEGTGFVIFANRFTDLFHP